MSSQQGMADTIPVKPSQGSAPGQRATPPTKEGWLFVKHKALSGSKKQTYCVLDTHSRLVMYKDTTKSKAEDVVPLEKVQQVLDVKNTDKHSFTFEIRMKGAQPPFVLSEPDKSNTQDWIHTLNDAILFLNKTAPSAGHQQNGQEVAIEVYTGPCGSFLPHADLLVILQDEQGNTSEQIPVHAVNANFKHTVDVTREEMGKIERDAKITAVKVQATLLSICYVKNIVVKNGATVSSIGVFDTAHFGSWLYSNNQTSLPQLDNKNEQKERRSKLEEMRKLYTFIEVQKGLPAEANHINLLDMNWNYTIHILGVAAETQISKMIDELGSIKLTTLKDLEKLYKCWFNKPQGLLSWRFNSSSQRDLVFANQRINGLNPSVIKLCMDEKSVKAKIAVTDDMLRPFLEGLTIGEAIEAKRLFVCDLEVLKGIRCKQGFVLCAPVGLFFVDAKRELQPVAIQLFQEKKAKNPVFLPSDDCWTWTLAKMWFNNADAAHHQSITHLGFTHLLMEGVVVASFRQLSQFHPIFKMLAPHFFYLISINFTARLFLITKGGIIDSIMNAGIEGTFEIIKKRLTQWRMDVDGTLPEELKQRGVDDPSVLPNYHYRDDALRVYDAIKDYVTDYVKLYYVDPSYLKGDWEIQAWAAELVKKRNNDRGGCGLLGVPGNGKLESPEDLITILTSIIYTCSAGHAAANFAQYDEYGFHPNYPGLLRGQPPTDKRARSEHDVLEALPDVKTILDTMQVTKLLSTKCTTSLGDFAEVPTITDKVALRVVEGFREKLKKLSEEIQEENKHRAFKYDHLDPQFVPNSISI